MHGAARVAEIRRGRHEPPAPPTAGAPRERVHRGTGPSGRLGSAAVLPVRERRDAIERERHPQVREFAGQPIAVRASRRCRTDRGESGSRREAPSLRSPRRRRASQASSGGRRAARPLPWRCAARTRRRPPAATGARRSRCRRFPPRPAHAAAARAPPIRCADAGAQHAPPRDVHRAPPRGGAPSRDAKDSRTPRRSAEAQLTNTQNATWRSFQNSAASARMSSSVRPFGRMVAAVARRSATSAIDAAVLAEPVAVLEHVGERVPVVAEVLGQLRARGRARRTASRDPAPCDEVDGREARDAHASRPRLQRLDRAVPRAHAGVVDAREVGRLHSRILANDSVVVGGVVARVRRALRGPPQTMRRAPRLLRARRAAPCTRDNSRALGRAAAARDCRTRRRRARSGTGRRRVIERQHLARLPSAARRRRSPAGAVRARAARERRGSAEQRSA